MGHDGSIDGGAYMRLALPMMSRHNVPVYPRNYAIWYEYVSGANLPLKQIIDEHIEHKRPFTEAVNKKLYLEHVAEPSEIHLINLQQGLIKALMDIQGNVTTADDASAQFESTLQRQAQLLRDNANQDCLHDILQTLRSELCTMQGSMRALQEGLKENSQEIERLRKELDAAKREAAIDPFTGLANRKALLDSLEASIHSSGENGEELCFLMLDIDHFKSINDNHGHLMGDKVISCVANIIKNCVKGNDLVGRYGGEEFAVLLSNTSYGAAVSIAETIRKTIERTKLVRSSSKETIGRVTISIGVARHVAPETPEQLIQRADAALYRSKTEGRNRVSGAPSSTHGHAVTLTTPGRDRR